MRRPLAIVALALATPAIAADSSEPGPESFECDAPAGRFSSYERRLGSGPVRVEASILLKDLRSSPRWAPVVNLALVPDNGSGAERLGVRLLPDLDTYDAHVEYQFPDDSGARNLPTAVVNAEREIKVLVEVTGKSLLIDAGSVSRIANSRPGATWHLRVSCSSVNARIDQLIRRGDG